ncbi:ABC transporter ATP-binding protein [Paenibacillus chartarius]|uniref:ABC transporter ATP-binding protein n=1 Tax=Paenibacillus chartarius TaxID=747481 RepID=A0ABV6DKS3_9BACL
MSSELAISVRNLSKSFHMFEKPIDRLKQTFLNKNNYHKDYWALDNVSFDVKKGETIGLIGRNGSGKSTILQIIAGILRPTSGEVVVNGRIAALLELGSGFNPEFTGRENVYLNGSILGLSKKKIDERMGEILNFADIGEFIDQPVKTYSSGMFVRLAFSVAVHSDPDILIVDEALSVGDALFQHKCIVKIKNMVKSGVTLFFVSHSPEAIRSLCKTGIWLENGKVRLIDDASKVSNAYLNEIYLEHNRLIFDDIKQTNNEEIETTTEQMQTLEHATNDIKSNEAVRVEHVIIRNSEGLPVESLEQSEEFTIDIKVTALTSIDNFSIGFLITDQYGIELTGESIFNKFRKSMKVNKGQSVHVSFRSRMILRGGQSYSVTLRMDQVSQWDRSDHILLYTDETAAVFKVIADIERPMWFKFQQEFEVEVNAT